jgi:hypothetical protein
MAKKIWKKGAKSEFRRVAVITIQRASREFVKASCDSSEMAGFDGRLINVKAR